MSIVAVIIYPPRRGVCERPTPTMWAPSYIHSVFPDNCRSAWIEIELKCSFDLHLLHIWGSWKWPLLFLFLILSRYTFDTLVLIYSYITKGITKSLPFHICIIRKRGQKHTFKTFCPLENSIKKTKFFLCTERHWSGPMFAFFLKVSENEKKMEIWAGALTCFCLLLWCRQALPCPSVWSCHCPCYRWFHHNEYLLVLTLHAL